MKKIYIVVISFLFLIVPTGVKAYGIDHFYMNATVQENGDIEVEEFFKMNGSYNGFGRIINYKNSSAPFFNPDDSSFGGSVIHNGMGIEVKEVKGVDLNTIKIDSSDIEGTFKSVRNNTDLFIETYSAEKGDYGKYIMSTFGDGIELTIYNPKSSKGFYIKYTLKNIGIVHTDVAEIGWNIFSEQMTESIRDFRLLIHIPNNQTELRTWAHGPLTGNVKPVGKNEIVVDIQGLPEKTAMDTRFVFDKSVLATSTKVTNVEALPKILTYETKKAESANKEREESKKRLAEEKFLNWIGTGIQAIWLLGLGVIVLWIYKKYDREYDSTFKGKYYRDFPSDINPETVGFLMNHKIDSNDLSATILNLVYKKKVAYEPLDKKDYKLIYKGNTDGLSSTEEKAIALLFEEGMETTLKEFQKRASSQYSDFLSSYETWKTSATIEGEEQNFFEKNSGSKTFATIYCVMGLIGAFFLFSPSFALMPVFVIGFAVATLIYLNTFYKRTHKGNEEYSKWNGLKNFINDFGQFKERELPQIELWEKYLIYAVTFKSAEKLSKQMEIKVQEYNLDTSRRYYSYGPNYFTSMLLFNHVMGQSITSAHTSAISARSIANSSSSSSGGFGGGFSGGGGSFGGGGGGGRF